MNDWLSFWKVFCAVGVVSFYLIVLAMIPMGVRDLFDLFRTLNEQATERNE